MSAPAEDPSHTTDQLGGKAVKLGNISSKVIPEIKATNKTEYTNTQQDLTVNGYNLVHLTRHARLFSWRGLFCRKSD